MLYYERKLKRQGCDLIIGVDEVGRGPLAGPVVAAAVLLKSHRFKNRIDDSKKLTPIQREVAFPEIADKSVYAFGIISEKIIDELNILNSTRLAMENAILSLVRKLKPKKHSHIHILVDGNVQLNIKFPYTNIIKGDAKSKSIASASILAKVLRDRIMQVYDRVYPGYGFIRHKGYPTRMHSQAIKKLGLSPIHRKTFYGAWV
jgi:ribonuclease HII